MQRIVPELRKVPYLQRIVVVLAKPRGPIDRARLLQDFYTPVTVIWVDVTGFRRFRCRAKDCCGGVVRAVPAGWHTDTSAMRDCGMIALHDCDIVSYDRQLLARLCYAIAHHASIRLPIKSYYIKSALPIECTAA